MILATDGVKTIAIFLYDDIRWGVEAQIGFNAGDGFGSYSIPEALTIRTVDVDTLTNSGQAGVFVFRLDSTLHLH